MFFIIIFDEILEDVNMSLRLIPRLICLSRLRLHPDVVSRQGVSIFLVHFNCLTF